MKPNSVMFSSNPEPHAASVTRVVHLRSDVSQQVLRPLPYSEAAFVSDPRHRCGNVRRNLADSRQRRIKAALIQVLLAHKPRQCIGGAHKHLVCDQTRPADDRAEPDAGEDVGVVALTWDEGFSIEHHWIVRATT